MTKRHFNARNRRRRSTTPLPDSLRPLPENAGEPDLFWLVLLFSDSEGNTIYATMSRGVPGGLPLLAAARARDAGAECLVLEERYGCRHTAKTRLMRIRRWPVAARRRLVSAANPSWRDLRDLRDHAVRAD